METKMSRRNTTLGIAALSFERSPRHADPFKGTPDGHVDSSVWDNPVAPIDVSPASRKGLGPVDYKEAQRLITKAELLAKRKRFKPRGMTQEAWEEAEALFKAKSERPYDPTEDMELVIAKPREPRETFRRWGSLPPKRSGGKKKAERREEYETPAHGRFKAGSAGSPQSASQRNKWGEKSEAFAIRLDALKNR